MATPNGRADRRPILHDSHETTMIHGALVRLGLAGMVLASAACGQGGKVTPDDGWRSLLPDGSLAAWRGYQSDTVPAAWSVADGVLTKTTGTGDLDQPRPVRRLRARARLEARLRAAMPASSIAAPRNTSTSTGAAPEYQLLDDANAPDGKNRLTSAASAYGLYARAGRHREAGRRVELDAHRRARRARRALAQRAEGGASTSCGVPTGRPRSRPASSATGRTTGRAKSGTSAHPGRPRRRARRSAT